MRIAHLQPGDAMMRLTIALTLTALLAPAVARASTKLADDLRGFDATVISPDSELGKKLPQMLGTALRARRDDANWIESKIWHLRIRNKTDWEEYRDARMKRLRASLGEFPAKSGELKVTVTNTLVGEGNAADGIVVDNL